MEPLVQTTPQRRSVTFVGDRLVLPDGNPIPVVSLPDHLVEWFERGRRSMYQRLAQGADEVGFFSHHLPVVVTRGRDEPFPFSCGNKGVGFLPRPERLAEYVDLYRRTMEETRGISWRDSLRQRLGAVSRFHSDRDSVDFRCLGTLEIFEKTTFRNLQRHPTASLLFTGSCPDYTSFQLNCGVEILEPGDPRLEFLRLARTLFEYDGFHIAQAQFRYAYLFWICEVVEKTPYRVESPVEDLAEDALPWDLDAERLLQRIPGLVRRHIRSQIEGHARGRGQDRVTAEFVSEVRHAMRLEPT